MKTLGCMLTILFSILIIDFASEAKTMENALMKAADSSSMVRIPRAKFHTLFREYVYQETGKDPSDIIISKFSVTHNQPVPEGKLDFHLFQKGKQTVKGYVKLIAIVRVDGVAESEVRMSGWVDVFTPIVCAARHLKRGEIIEANDVYLGRENVSRQPANILTDTKKALGMLVRNSIKQGDVIKEWMLEKNPILDKGDLVTILAQRDNIRITVPGRIMEKGYAGEMIKVQNTMSSKEIFARVMDHSTVIVDF